MEYSEDPFRCSPRKERRAREEAKARVERYEAGCPKCNAKGVIYTIAEAEKYKVERGVGGKPIIYCSECGWIPEKGRVSLDWLLPKIIVVAVVIVVVLVLVAGAMDGKLPKGNEMFRIKTVPQEE